MIKYDYYAVAFIDVLGQKEAFKHNGQYIDLNIRDREQLKERLNEAHSKTVAVIQKLRFMLEEMRRAKVQSSNRNPPEGFPAEKIDQYRSVMQSRVDFNSYSDFVFLHTKLESEPFYGSVLTSVNDLFVSCEAIMLDLLSKGKPCRGAIEVGMGTQLSKGEIYGPVTGRVYELESKVAQYPRVVIGNELINFLANNSMKHPQLRDQNIDDLNWCASMADLCLNRIKEDSDGIKILDYAGAESRKGLDPQFYQQYFDATKLFANSEYEKYKDIDTVLASRYKQLKDYLESS